VTQNEDRLTQLLPPALLRPGFPVGNNEPLRYLRVSDDIKVAPEPLYHLCQNRLLQSDRMGHVGPNSGSAPFGMCVLGTEQQGRSSLKSTNSRARCRRSSGVIRTRGATIAPSRRRTSQHSTSKRRWYPFWWVHVFGTS